MRSSTDQLWTHKGEKFTIGTIHGDPIEVVAQYNPKESARQASAVWNAHPNTSARQSNGGENHLWMEYGTTEPRTVTVELLFDGFEEQISIGPIIERLESLTMPVDMSSREPSKRRPQLCVAVWGGQKLNCVVTSVATKITMFAAGGDPLRASATVTFKEVDPVAIARAEGDATRGGNARTVK